MLTLCFTILLKSLTSISTSFLDFLGFSTYIIILSTNKENFTSSFSIYYLLFPFSCLIALVRTSIAILNKSGNRRLSYPVPDPGGSVQSFTIKCQWRSLQMPFIKLRKFHSISSLPRIFRRCVELGQIMFFIFQDDMISLQNFIKCGEFHWQIHGSKYTLQSGINLTWSSGIFLFICRCSRFVNILIGIFGSELMKDIDCAFLYCNVLI